MDLNFVSLKSAFSLNSALEKPTDSSNSTLEKFTSFLKIVFSNITSFLKAIPSQFIFSLNSVSAKLNFRSTPDLYSPFKCWPISKSKCLFLKKPFPFLIFSLNSFWKTVFFPLKTFIPSPCFFGNPVSLTTSSLSLDSP